MWTNEKSKKDKKQGSSETSLRSYILRKKQHLENEILRIPQIQDEILALEEQRDNMTCRWQVRMKNELQVKIDAAREEIRKLESEEHLAEFESISQPYMNASLRKNSCKPENAYAPGTVRKRNIEEMIDRNGGQSSKTLLSELMTEMDDTPPRICIERNDSCPKCNTDMLIQPAKATITCQSCGYMASYLDATSSSMSYTDDVEFACFSYKRINHFNEWLQQIQAKESTDIPQHIIQSVMEELYVRRITCSRDITPRVVRDILRVLKFRKTYEHVAQITSKITGENALRIPAEAEETCRLMFIAVQPVFDKVCPKDRKNFLSYAYILFKFFQLLGYDQLLDTFSLLKGRDKLQKQDDIFKLICDELDWEFVPSI